MHEAATAPPLNDEEEPTARWLSLRDGAHASVPDGESSTARHSAAGRPSRCIATR